GVGGVGCARVGAGDGVVGGHRGGAGVGEVLTPVRGGGADGQQDVGRAVATGVAVDVEALRAVGLGAPGGDGGGVGADGDVVQGRGVDVQGGCVGRVAAYGVATCLEFRRVLCRAAGVGDVLTAGGGGGADGQQGV